MIENHQIQSDGTWSCPMSGKNDVTCRTVHGGLHACGHCLKPLTDKEGKTFRFTTQDWYDMYYRVGFWEVKDAE